MSGFWVLVLVGLAAHVLIISVAVDHW